MRGVDALIRSETKRLEELKYQHAAAKKEGEALEQEVRGMLKKSTTLELHHLTPLTDRERIMDSKIESVRRDIERDQKAVRDQKVDIMRRLSDFENRSLQHATVFDSCVLTKNLSKLKVIRESAPALLEQETSQMDAIRREAETMTKQIRIFQTISKDLDARTKGE